MSDQPEIKTTKKYQLRIKLLRRIFVFFLVLFLLPLPLIPILSRPENIRKKEKEEREDHGMFP
jgi:hypothetical protein